LCCSDSFDVNVWSAPLLESRHRHKIISIRFGSKIIYPDQIGPAISGFGIFPLKIPNFSISSLWVKNLIGLGKTGRPLIYSRSKVCSCWFGSGQGPSLIYGRCRLLLACLRVPHWFFVTRTWKFSVMAGSWFSVRCQWPI